MKKNFIEEFKIDLTEEILPLTFHFLEGKKIVKNKNISFAKYAKCRSINSEGYLCFNFYKKISRYE
ncbi:hypothetical protein NBT05_06245 [Aquimarina sp. ERC-38]|uniref:hypothetical protein n=1 Tax=Aquimarina sp. ERC-38 TaxID=2949996 RepID=UPI00224799B7|nr:hypothetical protein [Aquimarina sp. ERC-38]UZO82068.1 hypothetical protein NBT05_06245 [Aquimarina sp. ERC-38]